MKSDITTYIADHLKAPKAAVVKNYAVFYVVKEQVVEIHRVVYAKAINNKGFK